MSCNKLTTCFKHKMKWGCNYKANFAIEICANVWVELKGEGVYKKQTNLNVTTDQCQVCTRGPRLWLAENFALIAVAELQVGGTALRNWYPVGRCKLTQIFAALRYWQSLHFLTRVSTDLNFIHLLKTIYASKFLTKTLWIFQVKLSQ